MEDGFYWVKPDTDDPWEVALYANEAWWFHGMSDGAEEVETIGHQVEPPT